MALRISVASHLHIRKFKAGWFDSAKYQNTNNSCRTLYIKFIITKR